MHGRLSAKEELQNIAGTPETQRIPHPLRIPPPLTFHDHNGKKNSILGYELVHAIQILDRVTRSESVSHAPSSIREGCHYSFQNAQESCRRIFHYWLGALLRDRPHSYRYRYPTYVTVCRYNGHIYTS